MKYHQCDAHVQHREFDKSTCLVMEEWFQLEFVNFFSLPVNMTPKTHSLHIKLPFSICDFERYANYKIDYLELLLSV